MVGTLEPRKGHPVALAAVETLWKQGFDVDLMIIGRRGWNMQHFEERLLTHPEINRRLFWVSDADDERLVQAYQDASALVYPSIAEGYGLPIIEAFSFGVRTIVSDLAIFREIAPPGSIFFKPCDADDLAKSVRECLDNKAPNDLACDMPTWPQAVEDALWITRNRAYQIDADRRQIDG